MAYNGVLYRRLKKARLRLGGRGSCSQCKGASYVCCAFLWSHKPIKSLWVSSVPLLDSLQKFPVFLELRSLDLNTILQIWPHQGGVKRKNNLSQPAGYAISNTPQDTTGLLGGIVFRAVLVTPSGVIWSFDILFCPVYIF